MFVWSSNFPTLTERNILTKGISAVMMEMMKTLPTIVLIYREKKVSPPSARQNIKRKTDSEAALIGEEMEKKSFLMIVNMLSFLFGMSGIYEESIC